MDKDKDRACPRCGSTQVAAIRYGKQAMTPELQLAIERGALVLGGCAQRDKPARHCNQCGHRWR